MRPPRFAESPQQRFVAGFDEHKRRRMIARERAVENRKFLDLFALAGIHKKSGALDFPAPLVIQLAEHGNQRHWKIVHTIKTEILKRIQDGTFAGAGKPSENYELAGVSRF
jgi:hypothetical protein